MNACLYIKWLAYIDKKCTDEPVCGKNVASTKIIVHHVKIKALKTCLMAILPENSAPAVRW